MKRFKGIVVEGDGLAGPALGAPTANLDLKNVHLDSGVYAAFADYNGNRYDATVCYGVGEPPKFEVHIFDFDKNILGEELAVEIVEKVSELVPWESTERMRQKILHDFEMAQQLLKTKKGR